MNDSPLRVRKIRFSMGHSTPFGDYIGLPNDIVQFRVWTDSGTWFGAREIPLSLEGRVPRIFKGDTKEEVFDQIDSHWAEFIFKHMEE